MTISQVVKKTGYSRGAYYNHIDNAELSFDILEAYGKTIGYDFSEEFPEMIKYVAFIMEPAGDYGDVSPDHLKKQINRWKDKYFDLLEKYNVLIEEKLRDVR